MPRTPRTVEVPNTPHADFEALLAGFSKEKADTWLRHVFGSYEATQRRELPVDGTSDYREHFADATLMGYVKNLPKAARSEKNAPMVVAAVHMQHSLERRDSRTVQFNYARKIIQKEVESPAHGVHGLPTQGLFFFYDDYGHFRLSLVTGDINNNRFDFNSVRRQSFLVDEGGKNNTIRRRFLREIKTLADVKAVFSVEALTKEFYEALFNWFVWATEEDKSVTFPNDLSTPTDNRDYLAEAIIRLITRLMFIWFIKQKGIVPDELFDAESVKKYVKNFAPASQEQDNYYRVILQNLFFATLNCREDKRKCKRNYRGMSNERGIATCYRYVAEMKNKDAFLQLMGRIPFLNCALFDCLDKIEREQDGGRKLYLDGFSDRSKRQAHIHNAFFFDESKGLLPLFKQYEFTVDENSLTDSDVALDPELLGKVFENLLGSYNPETKETARKATGAFYTPREIVNYMVREALKCHLKRMCPFADDKRLAELFDPNRADQETDFTMGERKALLEAIYSCKILDPACGSGAFPMGILNTMVFVLTRLDDDNVMLRQKLLQRYQQDKAITIQGASRKEMEERAQMLDKQLKEGQLYPDYARKLYLIENCIYGIDIQPIATQISKLRFFISLLCDQLRSTYDPEAPSYGLLSLPNLESKFVCADTLKSLPKLAGGSLAMATADIQELKAQLNSYRHEVFLARTFDTKEKYKRLELETRDKIRESIQTTLSTPNTELIEGCKETIAKLKEELQKYLEPKIELQQVTEQHDLFEAREEVMREVDVNEQPRKRILDDIARAERAIATEDAKVRQAGTTELDMLALAVSKWDPYDQNACSDFFDADWMFNVRDGFDIVIGNPPYFVLKNSHPQKDNYKENHSEVVSGRINAYQLFFSFATNNLANFGTVAFIHPKTLFCDAYLAATRKFLAEHYNSVKIINFIDRKKSFASVLQSVTITIWRNAHIPQNEVAEIDNKDELEELRFISLTREELYRDSLFVVSKSREVYEIIAKMNSSPSKHLKFITGTIEWNKYKKMLSCKKMKHKQRLIYSSNIQRYYFLDNTGKDLAYLSINNAACISKPTILVQRTTSIEQDYRIIATVINPSQFNIMLLTENGTNCFAFDDIDDALFCLGVFNSNLADFYLRAHNSNTHVSSHDLYRIPIATASSKIRKKVIATVRSIMESKQKNHNADISKESLLLNDIVYSLYGINETEKSFVEHGYSDTIEVIFSKPTPKSKAVPDEEKIEGEYLD